MHYLTIQYQWLTLTILPGLANKSDILNNTQYNCNTLAVQN